MITALYVVRYFCI